VLPLARRASTSTREKDVDKTIVGLVGAISTVAAVGVAPTNTAQASPAASPGLAEVMRVEAYEDLLKPIPNAVALLREDETMRAQAGEATTKGDVQLAYHHHHHHHHRWWRRWHRYHHHHHHHHHHHY
jgi:hypothetical protein